MTHRVICLSATVLMLRVVPCVSASLLLQFASDTASIPVGQNVSGQTGGGSRQHGGVDVSFAEVTQAGTFVAQPLSLGDLDPQVLADFQSLTTHFLAGDPPQVWQITFDGQFTAAASVALGFDPLALGDVAHDDLVVLKRDDQTSEVTVIVPDMTANHPEPVLTFSTSEFSTFGIGAPVPEPASISLAALGLLWLSAHRRRPTTRRA